MITDEQVREIKRLAQTFELADMRDVHVIYDKFIEHCDRRYENLPLSAEVVYLADVFFVFVASDIINFKDDLDEWCINYGNATVVVEHVLEAKGVATK